MADGIQPGGVTPVLTPSFRHYVAIGDSLSEGLGDPVSGAELGGWATCLARWLQAVTPSMRYTNLAVRGHTASKALAGQLGPAVAAAPDLVSIFIGGNDVLLRPGFDARRFADELDQLTAPFAGPGTTTVLSTLPDLTACSPLPPPLRGALRRRIVSANKVIKAVSTEYRTLLLDAWADPRTRRHGMWSIDRIHPSTNGHRLIAHSVAELLGLPADVHRPAELPQESHAATVGRHLRELAWLSRHARRAPERTRTDSVLFSASASVPLLPSGASWPATPRE
jgi:lysophospholipase L1-like esterase